MLELRNERTLNSKTFLVDEETGAKRAEIHLSPIHHMDWDTGQLEDNDYTIMREQNWEFEYAVKKNTFRAYFNDSTDISNSTLASFEILNSQGVARWINYKLFGAEPTGHSYEENRFKFHNVFPGVDLEYIVNPERLKENIIVNEPIEDFSFAFTLKLSDGLRMEQQEDGSVFFIDTETDEKLWEISKPYAMDSSPEPVYTEAVEYVLGKQVYDEVEYDGITVNLLADVSELTFPIVIDPTIGQIFPGKDTYVNQTRTQNFGTSTTLKIGDDWIQSGSEYNRKYAISLFGFDVSSVPNGANIVSATVYFTPISINFTDTNMAPRYHLKSGRIPSAWVENTVKYINGMDLDKQEWAGYVWFEGSNKSGYVDVTQAYREGLTEGAPMDGVWVGLGGYNNNTGEVAYGEFTIASRENSNASLRPYLNIQYGFPPTEPQIINPVAGNKWTSNKTITWIASTDQDTPQGSLQYHIQLSTDAGATYKDIVALTPAGATSYQYNFSGELETSQAKIRIRAYDGLMYSSWGVSGTFSIGHSKTYVKANGVYVNAKAFIKQGGVYIEVGPHLKIDGIYQKI